MSSSTAMVTPKPFSSKPSPRSGVCSVKNTRVLVSRFTDSRLCMQKQRGLQEAESAALAAYEGYVKTFGKDDDRTESVVAQLGDLYAAASQRDKAREWRAKLRKK